MPNTLSPFASLMPATLNNNPNVVIDGQLFRNYIGNNPYGEMTDEILFGAVNNLLTDIDKVTGLDLAGWATDLENLFGLTSSDDLLGALVSWLTPGSTTTAANVFSALLSGIPGLHTLEDLFSFLNPISLTIKSVLSPLLSDVGTFLSSLIPNLDASKITTGQFSLAQIPDIALNMVTGLLDSGGQILAGLLGNSYNNLISLWPNTIGGLTGSTGLQDIYKDITGLLGNPTALGSGSPVLASIANIPILGGLLSAAGTFLASLIPGLDGSKIVSGTVSLSYLPTSILTTASSIAASAIAGVLQIANIPTGSLGAGNIADLQTLVDDLYQVVNNVTTTGHPVSSFITGLQSLMSNLFGQSHLGTVLSTGVIPNLNASIINAGTFLASLIPGLDGSKIVSGTVSLSYLPTSILTTASSIAASALSGLASGIGSWLTGGGALPSATTLSGSQLTGSVASSLLSGVLGTGLIPNITKAMSTDLQSVIDGVYQAANGGSSTGNTVASVKTSLLNLPGANIVSALAQSVIPSLSAAWGNTIASSLLSGVLGAGLIPGLDGSKIVSGTVSLSYLPTSILTTASSIAASAISGVLGTANIPALAISAITGLSGYLTNLNSSGVFSLSGLANGALPSGVTSAIGQLTGLASGIGSWLSSGGALPGATTLSSSQVGNITIGGTSTAIATAIQSTIDDLFHGYTGSTTTNNTPSALDTTVGASINNRLTALEGSGVITQYTSNGTWTKPTTSPNTGTPYQPTDTFQVICINGGQGGSKPGAGAVYAPGGVSGGYVQSAVQYQNLPATAAMTIGAAGAGATAGGAGSAGGVTSFGSLVTGKAGVGAIQGLNGTFSTTVPPGNGGYGGSYSYTTYYWLFPPQTGQSGPFAAGGAAGLGGAAGGAGGAAPTGVPSGGAGGGGGGTGNTSPYVGAGGAGGFPGGGGGGGGNEGELSQTANGGGGAAGAIYVIAPY